MLLCMSLVIFAATSAFAGGHGASFSSRTVISRGQRSGAFGIGGDEFAEFHGYGLPVPGGVQLFDDRVVRRGLAGDHRTPRVAVEGERELVVALALDFKVQRSAVGAAPYGVPQLAGRGLPQRRVSPVQQIPFVPAARTAKC